MSLLLAISRSCGSRMRVGQELLGALSVVLDQVDRKRNLQGGLLPRLSRLALEQLRDALIVVEQPVTQAPDPFAPAARSQRLPRRLVLPQPPDGGAHLLSTLIGQGPDHGAVRGRPHLEARTRLRAVPRPARSDRVRARRHHLGLARSIRRSMISRHDRQYQSPPGRERSTRGTDSIKAGVRTTGRAGTCSPPTRSTLTLAIPRKR